MSRSPFRHVSPGRRSCKPLFPPFQSHPSYLSASTAQYADQTRPLHCDGMDRLVWEDRQNRRAVGATCEPGEFTKRIGCTSMTTCISEFAALHPLPSNATQLPRCLSTFSVCRSSHSSATELFQRPCLTSNLPFRHFATWRLLILTELTKPQLARSQHAILNSLCGKDKRSFLPTLRCGFGLNGGYGTLHYQSLVGYV